VLSQGARASEGNRDRPSPAVARNPYGMPNHVRLRLEPPAQCLVLQRYVRRTVCTVGLGQQEKQGK